MGREAGRAQREREIQRQSAKRERERERERERVLCGVKDRVQSKKRKNRSGVEDVESVCIYVCVLREGVNERASERG